VTRQGRSLMVFLLLMLLAGYAPGAGGAEPRKKGPEGEFPLHITAARLEADQKDKIITFTGQVKAQYGDSTLYAEQLRIYYQAKPAAADTGAPVPSTARPAAEKSPLGDLGGEKIDRIVAQGQVRFVQEDKVATGQEAIYYKNREEVVLLGNPQVWRGENCLKGERIIFNLRDNRMVVESSPQKRVEANLYPATQRPLATQLSLPGARPRKGAKPQDRKP
jgi:lipopolysaccharide export system protein LptA